MRRALWVLPVLLAVAFAAFAVALVRASSPDCHSFADDTAAFRVQQSSRDEAAETLVRCAHLVGRTQSQVVSALGEPDWRGQDADPRPHREFSYTVALERGWISESPITLHMELDRGRVVFAEVAGGSRREITDGEPVSG